MGRVVYACDSVRAVAHCLYALGNSFKSRLSRDCTDSYCRNGAGVVDEGDVKARLVVAFGLCFEPSARYRKEKVSEFCSLGGLFLIFEVWGPNVVYHFLVCWFAIYFFEDGGNRSSARM